MMTFKNLLSEIWDSMLARCALLALACGVFPFWLLSMAMAAIRR